MTDDQRQSRTNSGIVRWFGPYRSIGQFPIDEETREHLRRVRRKAVRWIVIGTLPAVVLLGSVVVAVATYSLRSMHLVFGYAVVLGLFSLFLTVIGLGIANTPLKRRRWVKRNLADGRVERFVLFDSDTRVSAGAAQVEGAITFLEVFSGTGTLARSDAGFAEPREPAMIAEIAAPGTLGETPASAGRRTFKAEELRELDELRRKLSFIRARPPLAMLFMLAIIGIKLVQILTLRDFLAIMTAGAGVYLIWWVVRAWKLTPLRGYLRRGIELGQAESMLSEEYDKRNPEFSYAPDSTECSRVMTVEVIAETPVLWTVDGNPAIWRVAALEKVRSNLRSAR